MSESPRAGANEPLSAADGGCSEREILERLARGAPLAELLSAITTLGDHAIEGAACSIWLIEDGVLHRGAPSNLPEELLHRMDGVPVEQGIAGSCGLAASRRERCVISDVSAHPSWSRHRDTFLAHGFHASWSTPISSGERLWGTLAAYVREPRSPTTEECSRLDSASHLAAIALELAQTRHERSVLEARLRETEPLHALGRLASGIAHDFNNVLTAISGHAHLALLDLDEERPVRESLVAIQEASVRAAEVVRKILSFRRSRPPQKSQGRLEPIVNDALALLRSALPTAIAIHCRVEDATPLVYADPVQIQQVLLSLCTHAARTMGDRGRLSLEVEAISAQHEDLEALDGRRARYARLCVKDDGPGLESSIRKRIFEPFAQPAATGERTGLELSVAHDIVKAHGGLIAVHGRPGEGNEFRVYLPEAKTDDESRPPPAHGERTKPADSVAPEPVRVMYVDDEEPLVALAVRWLGRLGYKVTGFNDSEAALEAFRNAPRDFDAVISDFSMPTLSGLDLLREILAIRPDTVVIMSSGYVLPQDSDRARELGAVAVVSKPQGMAEFGRILHRILSERRPSSVPSSE